MGAGPARKVFAAKHEVVYGFLLAALVLPALAACGGHWTYDKPSATHAQVDRDMTECERIARPQGALAYPALVKVDRDRFNACMERRGYTVRKS